MKNENEALINFMIGILVGGGLGVAFGLFLRGRMPEGNRQEQLLRLQHRLEAECKKAVEKEDYEHAASLRDRIRAIEKYLYNSAN